MKSCISRLLLASMLLSTVSFLLSCVVTQAFTHTVTFHNPTKLSFLVSPDKNCKNQKKSFALTVSAVSDGGPAVLEPPKTVEKKDTDVDKSTKRDEKFDSSGWEIRLYNDPFNKREFVARCLAEICGKSDAESFQIMMQAHNDGMGVIGRYMFEVAELYYNSLNEQGLLVDMVHVDDEG